MVPPVVLLLAKHPSVNNFDLSYLTEVTSGAAPLGKDLSKALMDRLPLLSSVRQGKCAALINQSKWSGDYRDSRALIGRELRHILL